MARLERPIILILTGLALVLGGFLFLQRVKIDRIESINTRAVVANESFKYDNGNLKASNSEFEKGMQSLAAENRKLTSINLRLLKVSDRMLKVIKSTGGIDGPVLQEAIDAIRELNEGDTIVVKPGLTFKVGKPEIVQPREKEDLENCQ